MNWLDIFIVLFLLAALVRGTEVGFTRQFFSTTGFFIGLFLGAWLESQIIHLVHTPGRRALLALVMILGMALAFWALGEWVGWRLKFKLQRAQVADKVDRIFGSILAGLTLLAAVWLGAAIFRNGPDGVWQRGIRSSRVISSLNQILPSAPNLLTDLGHLIDPNNFPQVFAGLEPQPNNTKVILSDLGELNNAIEQDRASVVKIEGKGCGGVVQGTGFVASNNQVLTNAHVVAGVKRPFIIDGNGTHDVTVVYFDPDLDIAVLRATNLSGKPLGLNAETTPNGTAVALLGYPGGKNLGASPGAILDSFTAVGHNIYNQGDTQRQVYSVKADIEEGDSGGPLLTKDGSVVGVVFAKSTNYDQVGYALTVRQLVPSLSKADSQTSKVNTGECAE